MLSLIHILVQTCSFVIRNNNNIKLSTFIRLTDFDSSKEKQYKYISLNRNLYSSYRFNNVDIKNFYEIEGVQLAYWLDSKYIDAFKYGEKLKNVSDLKTGLSTMDNNRFLRYWYEVNNNNIGYNVKSIEESVKSVSYTHLVELLTIL